MASTSSMAVRFPRYLLSSSYNQTIKKSTERFHKPYINHSDDVPSTDGSHPRFLSLTLIKHAHALPHTHTHVHLWLTLTSPPCKVTFVAKIRSVAETSTLSKYMMEDSTGSVETSLWVDQNDTDASARLRSEWTYGVCSMRISHVATCKHWPCVSFSGRVCMCE